MRRSLGSKRREIPDAGRQEIVRIYAEMLNGGDGYGEFSKIFDVVDFGYREIRVERPLRLIFHATEAHLARLTKEKAIQKLDVAAREELMDALTHHLPSLEFNSRDAFEKALAKALRVAGVKVGAPVKKAILAALSERDEAAEICFNDREQPEPDTDLRDHELVPLKEDWRYYVAREVTPFVSDAWVDENYRDERDGETGRVGYEINFNRYFYKYVPPRPLNEIDAELKGLEAQIADLLREVAA
jgi:type I restriction enzyme M protein